MIGMEAISTKVKVAVLGFLVTIGIAFESCPDSLSDVIDGVSIDVEQDEKDAGS